MSCSDGCVCRVCGAEWNENDHSEVVEAERKRADEAERQRDEALALLDAVELALSSGMDEEVYYAHQEIAAFLEEVT